MGLRYLSPMAEPLLSLTNIQKSNGSGFVLSGIDFEQRKGEKIAIVGETGSGKSTLLKIIAGLEQPDQGEVRLLGERVAGPQETLVAGHAGIGYLSQHFDLPKFLRVEQVLRYATHLSDKASRQLNRICRIDHLLARKTHELSGGEKQRIALARLLSSKPHLLLLDEPYAHLDAEMKATLKAVVDDLTHKLNISMILVSHDPDDTLPWADSIVVLRHGTLVQRGTPSHVYHRPANAYAAALFGEFNQLSPAVARKLQTNSVLLVRPEQLRIVRQAKNCVTGTIQAVRFFGNHQTLLIAVRPGRPLLTVWASARQTFRAGDKVKVAYAR